MRYHYFYKIVNKINQKYYYGVHNTDDLNDGYMGSGLKIQAAISKYGVENFEKIIIRSFDTAEEAFKYESQIVTEDLVKDPNCYNIAPGGQGGFVSEKTVAVVDNFGNKFGVTKDDPRLKSGELRSVVRGTIRTEENKQSISNGVKEYYVSVEGEKRKSDIKNERKKFWSSEKGIEMRKQISQHNKEFYKSELGKDVHRRALEARRRNGVSQSQKDKQSKNMFLFWNTEKGKMIRTKMNVGKNNSRYGTGKHYKLVDAKDNSVIFDDVCNYDLKQYFHVPSFDASWYCRTRVLYKKRYMIEKIPC